MSGFVEGIDRSQSTLFPAMLDDYVSEDNLVRAVDAFVEGLDLGKLGFGRVAPLEKGRPAYHPSDAAQDIHLRLSQSRSVEPPPGAGMPAQHRAGLADGASGTGFQDHC